MARNRRNLSGFRLASRAGICSTSHMKTALVPLVILACATISAYAADPFEIPSFVKELDQLDKVMSDAAKENKGVTFLLMQSGST